MPYRGQALTCRDCGIETSRTEVEGIGYQHCEKCGGAWLEPSTLATLWQHMGGAGPLAFADRAARGAARPCLVCGAAMAPVHVAGSVPIDRCEPHGVWFDAAELGVALAAAYLAPDDWRRQFGRLVKKFT
jgi:Zn-finger nucleic acid-binding protein